MICVCHFRYLSYHRPRTRSAAGITTDNGTKRGDPQQQRLKLDRWRPPSGVALGAGLKDLAMPLFVPDKDWNDFAIGDVFECQDTVGKWYESTIRDVKPDTIHVHFRGWADTWDGK
jgi:hypothetical protein